MPRLAQRSFTRTSPVRYLKSRLTGNCHQLGDLQAVLLRSPLRTFNMSGDSKKTAIPAWQRSQPTKPLDTPTAAPTPTEADIETSSEEPESSLKTATTHPTDKADIDSAAQLENMKTFLEDPSVRDAPLDKKRAFFANKGIAQELVDQALQSEASTTMSKPAISTSDFEAFKATQQVAQQSAQQPQAAPPTFSSPPIITYPEFLVEAHKPPPLITVSRLWNTAQIAGGVGALIYGASKYLVAPMSENMNEARHDFAVHSQTKIHEMNERLSKLVSNVPSSGNKKDVGANGDMDDLRSESETSDPTELYHRDMGTQTSPLPSPRTSDAPAATKLDDEDTGKSQTDLQITSLNTLTSHLNDMLSRTQNLESANRERADRTSNLRHYLDTLMYASPGVAAWSSMDDMAKVSAAGTVNAESKKESEDVIEELKREIRGVKGSLLSAKRFPGVAGRVGGA